MSMRTVSSPEKATHRRSTPKRSTAQRMTAEGGWSSNSASSRSSSSSFGSRMRAASGVALIVASRPRALAGAHVAREGPGLVEVDVEVGLLVGSGEDVQVLERGAHRAGPTGPLQPGGEVLAGLALAGEAAAHPHRRLAHVLGREPQSLGPELDLGLAHVAPEQHLVPRGRLPVGPTLDAEEPDVRGVVLAA